jgi:hypothetical protein
MLILRCAAGKRSGFSISEQGSNGALDQASWLMTASS